MKRINKLVHITNSVYSKWERGSRQSGEKRETKKKEKKGNVPPLLAECSSSSS